MADTPMAKILIVDDELAQMEALRATLGDHGYDTVGCGSGAAALAILKQQSFDLLLTDLMMPQMDGIQLLRSALAADPSLVAIIMTGEGSIATAVQAMQSGALDYILKPFKLSAILPVLARALTVRSLQRRNAELQARVRKHATDLEAANRDLEAFSYSVSHDLRAPLRTIEGFRQLLVSGHAQHLDAQAVNYLERIGAGTRLMSHLIDDLLRLSQLGRQSLQKQSIEVGALVQEVLEELRQERVLLHHAVSVASHFPFVQADPTLLRLAFVNLLSNACKYSAQQARPRIEVGCETMEGEAVFFVLDNGAGFDMAAAKNLFQPFHRLHRADKYEGNGVGLSIVQRVVQRHGGRIWARAEVDKGACFYFTLSEPVAGP